MKWIEFIKTNPNAKLRLICCHHSGAGASTFYPWAGIIQPSAELAAIQLPGRETRFSEPLLNTMEAVIDGLLNDIKFLFDKPFILFGHSVGALIVYELCIRLQKLSQNLPKHLIVSGCRAPHLMPLQNIHTLPEDQFIIKLMEYKGTPQELLENTDILELFLPILRSDFAISETYKYQNNPPLLCDITALGGTEDSTVPIERLKAWEQHTQSNFKYDTFPGDHFFVKSFQTEVIQAVNEITNRCLLIEKV